MGLPNPDCDYCEAEIIGLAARTTGGNSGTLEDFTGLNAVQLYVFIESVQANGGLVVSIDDSADGDNWRQIATRTIANLTTSDTDDLVADSGLFVSGFFARRLRVRWEMDSGFEGTFKVDLVARNT